MTLLLSEVTEQPIVRKPWRNNQVSSTVILSLPYELCVKHGIEEGTLIAVYDKPDSIILKKLEAKG